MPSSEWPTPEAIEAGMQAMYARLSGRERRLVSGDVLAILTAAAKASPVIPAAEAERMRAALELIASCDRVVHRDVVDIARTALAGGEVIPAPKCEACDATNAVRLCNRCESEMGVSAGADAGDRACSSCGQHDAPHVYPAARADCHGTGVADRIYDDCEIGEYVVAQECEPCDETGVAEVIPVAPLLSKLGEMELYDGTGDPYDSGYMAAWREIRAALDEHTRKEPT